MSSTNGFAKMSAASKKAAGRSRDFSSDSEWLPETDARRSISKSHDVLQDHQISSTSTAEAEDNNEAIAAKASKTSLVQVLGRNCSISSASSSSYRFKFDNKQQSSFLETSAKKVFSLRRCSSVSSDRYCRIHDQTVTTLSSSSSTIYDKGDGDGDDEAIDMGEVEIKNRMPSVDEDSNKQKKKQRRPGKIFKACKRILGL